MCISNLLAFTSHFSAVAAELLISRHAPCHKHLFLAQKFHFRWIPRDYPENHRNSCEKAGIPANSFSAREGRSAGGFPEKKISEKKIPYLAYSALCVGGFPEKCFSGKNIRMDSGALRVARGGTGARAPPLAARQVVGSIPSETQELKFLWI